MKEDDMILLDLVSKLKLDEQIEEECKELFIEELAELENKNDSRKDFLLDLVKKINYMKENE